MYTVRNDLQLAPRRPLHREGGEHPSVRRPPGLWVPTAGTAGLLEALSRRLGLGWRLNHAGRPGLLVLTNLGRADPEKLAGRCRPERVVLCLDDRAGRDFLARTDLPCFTYSEGRPEADLTAHDLRPVPGGLTFLAVTRGELARATVPPGDLYRALAALASCAALGVPLAAAARGVSELLCPPDTGV